MIKIIIFCFYFISHQNIWAGNDKSKTAYQLLLENYVVKKKSSQTYVNYRILKENQEQLNEALKGFSLIKEEEFNKWTQNEKLAFLINAYNIFTIKLIVDHYPIKSIKDIGFFFQSPWKKNFFTLLEKERNLDELEHTMIRKNFKEPRVHYALNCASLSCPSLSQKAYSGSELANQLFVAETSFLSNKEKNHFKDNTLYVSKIFDWYGEDFGKLKEYLKNHFKEYDPEKHPLKFLPYDWGLNETEN